MLYVCDAEHVQYESSGLEAIVFIAEGDMRNALNSLQSTVSGFGVVNSVNVFKVCDQPQPMKVRAIINNVRIGKMKEAMDGAVELIGSGYAATDVIQTLFKVTRSFDMPEPEKLEYLREIGFSHMRISEGLNTQLQILGCISRLSQLSSTHNIH